MPEILNRDILIPFPPLAPGWSSRGVRKYVHQRGFRSLEGEDPNQVLTYTGHKYETSILRFAPKPGRPHNAFYANGVSSETPYLGNTAMVTEHAAIARNKAYAKFKEAVLGPTSEMGTFIAEGRESYGLIANRATGLYRSYRELRKGNFRGFLRELSVKPKRKHRSVVRTSAGEASGLWLEYWFGWSPAVNDLHSAYRVLTSQKQRGTRTDGTSGSRLPLMTADVTGPSACRSTSVEGIYLVKTGATYKLVNPNAAIRTSLGLNNPLAIAWEVVPFSFVVDWFTQFGNCISAMTDFAGFELTDAYRTDFIIANQEFETWYRPDGRGNNIRFRSRHFKSSRTKGLAYPLPLRPRLANFGSSVTRAATAVSLLTAIFLDR